jgi:hypothetical protein
MLLGSSARLNSTLRDAVDMPEELGHTILARMAKDSTQTWRSSRSVWRRS